MERLIGLWISDIFEWIMGKLVFIFSIIGIPFRFIWKIISNPLKLLDTIKDILNFLGRYFSAFTSFGFLRYFTWVAVLVTVIIGSMKLELIETIFTAGSGLRKTMLAIPIIIMAFCWLTVSDFWDKILKMINNIPYSSFTMFFISTLFILPLLANGTDLIQLLDTIKSLFTSNSRLLNIGFICFSLISIIVLGWATWKHLKKDINQSSDSFNTKVHNALNILMTFGLMFLSGMILKSTVNLIPPLKNWVETFKKTAWGIFSLVILLVTYILTSQSKEDFMRKYEKDMEFCESNYEDKYHKADCKKQAEKEKKKNVPSNQLTWISTIIFLVLGFLFIDFNSLIGTYAGGVFAPGWFGLDSFRSYLLTWFLMTLFIFVSFQYYSERYNPGTFDSIPNETYLPGNIAFAGLIMCLFIGLASTMFNINDYPGIGANGAIPGIAFSAKKDWFWKRMKKVFKRITFVLAFYFSVVFFSSIFASLNNSVFNGITITLLVGFLISILYVYLDTWVSDSGFIRNIINSLLIIPCICHLLINAVVSDVHKTPKTVFIVLLTELVLISIYFAGPLLINNLSGSYYVPKNVSVQLSNKLNSINTQLSWIESWYDKLNYDFKIHTLMNKKEWSELINKGYYRGNSVEERKLNIKNYCTKIKENKINETIFNEKYDSDKNDSIMLDSIPSDRLCGDENTNPECVDPTLDGITTQILRETVPETANTTSNTRLEQLIRFIEVILRDNSKVVNILGLQSKEASLKLEKVEVEEKIKTEKVGLNKPIILLSRPQYLDSEIKPGYVENKDDSKDITNRCINQSYTWNGIPIKKTKRQEGKENPKTCTPFPLQIVSGDKKNNYNYNYALSFWINFHSQPGGFRESYVKFTNILDFGNNPLITYNPSNDILKVQVAIKLPNKCLEDRNNCCDGNKAKENELNLINLWCKESMTNNSSEQKITIFEKEGLLRNQKWNNIVINYDLGVLDIFVNSKLVGTWKDEIMYHENKNIILGQNKGIAGGICNVVYYPTAILLEKIKRDYNLLKSKNPPII